MITFDKIMQVIVSLLIRFGKSVNIWACITKNPFSLIKIPVQLEGL